MTASPALAELPAGFASPGVATQAVFRCALDAWSRPGRVQSLPPAACAALVPPAPLSPALAALLLTLLDGEVSLWMSPSLDHPLVRAWLAFHTGVRRVDDPAQARFVAADAREVDLALWARLERGSDELPQDGATLLLDMRSLTRGPALTLRGPGIADTQELTSEGLAPEVWRSRAADTARYPLGVDLLLCCDHTLVGVPRSTRITGAR